MRPTNGEGAVPPLKIPLMDGEQGKRPYSVEEADHVLSMEGLLPRPGRPWRLSHALLGE